jgi:hypothetical protein
MRTLSAIRGPIRDDSGGRTQPAVIAALLMAVTLAVDQRSDCQDASQHTMRQLSAEAAARLQAQNIVSAKIKKY